MTDPATLMLPHDSTAPGLARAFVRSWLASRQLETLLDSAVLLTSEVVTNAVLHATGPIELHLDHLGDGARVAVADTSPIGPRRRRHSDRATTGRGLQLIDDVAGDWGWDAAPNGKRVWFTLSAQDDPWARFSDCDWLAGAEA